MSKTTASANWLALQKKIKPAKTAANSADAGPIKKKRKLTHSPTPSSSTSTTTIKRVVVQETKPEPEASQSDLKNGESKSALKRMIYGEIEVTEQQQQPGKYLALDCEMVGVGIDGSESSLARVSLVNYYGFVIMDEFVRQRERVVDYRTQYSGIRASDMVKAKPFEDVQKRVAELLKDRILIGHAVHNDLKALLLSYPRPQVRDTQIYAGKFKVVKSRHVALRNLVKQELDTVIQAGEHSSITDARATMAIYRLHRKEWEKNAKPPPTASSKGKKRERQKADDEPSEEEESSKNKKEFPGGGRKGVSSGLSTIVHHGEKSKKTGGSEKKKWWKEMLSEGAAGAKGSISL